jgi:hypothetical protein
MCLRKTEVAQGTVIAKSPVWSQYESSWTMYVNTRCLVQFDAGVNKGSMKLAQCGYAAAEETASAWFDD